MKYIIIAADLYGSYNGMSKLYLKLFSICSFKVDGENKYMNEIQELIQPERNTLAVSFNDIESHNSKLSTIIQEEYYRYWYIYFQNTTGTVLINVVQKNLVWQKVHSAVKVLYSLELVTVLQLQYMLKKGTVMYLSMFSPWEGGAGNPGEFWHF